MFAMVLRAHNLNLFNTLNLLRNHKLIANPRLYKAAVRDWFNKCLATPAKADCYLTQTDVASIL